MHHGLICPTGTPSNHQRLLHAVMDTAAQPKCRLAEVEALSFPSGRSPEGESMGYNQPTRPARCRVPRSELAAHVNDSGTSQATSRSPAPLPDLNDAPPCLRVIDLSVNSGERCSSKVQQPHRPATTLIGHLKCVNCDNDDVHPRGLHWSSIRFQACEVSQIK